MKRLLKALKRVLRRSHQKRQVIRGPRWPYVEPPHRDALDAFGTQAEAFVAAIRPFNAELDERLLSMGRNPDGSPIGGAAES